MWGCLWKAPLHRDLKKRSLRKRGPFTGGISRISKISKFSGISRKWWDSPLFSTVWGFSRISRISRKIGLFWKDPFSKRPLFPNPIAAFSRYSYTWHTQGTRQQSTLGHRLQLAHLQSHGSCACGFGHWCCEWSFLDNGVGVDGVGGVIPFFLRLFVLSFLFFAYLRFSCFSPRGQGQTTAIYCKNGEFHSDSICTNPVQNFPTFSFQSLRTSPDQTILKDGGTHHITFSPPPPHAGDNYWQLQKLRSKCGV